jgi:hypothetical protein
MYRIHLPFYPEDGAASTSEKSVKLLPDYTALQPSRQPSSSNKKFGEINFMGFKIICEELRGSNFPQNL